MRVVEEVRVRSIRRNFMMGVCGIQETLDKLSTALRGHSAVEKSDGRAGW